MPRIFFVIIGIAITSHCCAAQVPHEADTSAADQAAADAIGVPPSYPSKVVGYEACAKCHANEIGIWHQTPHFETFRSLHRQPAAQEIADKMGLRSIKRGDVCIQCHYTRQEKQGRVKAVSGISCESCHGPAADWIDVHADYGGPHVTRETESVAHREQRIRTSIALGMRNPANVYLLARSCLNCHTVPHEKLVNVGGHTAGSLDFELVSWSQGAIRHNFVRSHGTANVESSADRLRVMYVVGLLADLEYSLRATALATVKSHYGMTCARRADRRRWQIAEIQQEIDNDQLRLVLGAVLPLKLKLNNRQNIEAAANRVGLAAYTFAQEADGSLLEAVDKWIPAARK